MLGAYDVLIIGAGASGLMCASEASRKGRSVLVLEHNTAPAKKVGISGGGRCNFTNLGADWTRYLSSNRKFCHSALCRFTPQDFMAFLDRHRIGYHAEGDGRMFCDSSSNQVVKALLDEAILSGAEIEYGRKISKVGFCPQSATDDAHRFAIDLESGRRIMANSVVIATGGLSLPQLGATNFGFTLARQFGLRVSSLRPALTPFRFTPEDEKKFQGMSGISVDASISCGEGKRFREKILFTHRGLSGPAALQASLYWSPGMPLVIDLLPEHGLDEVVSQYKKQKRQLQSFLSLWLAKRLAQRWIELCLHSEIGVTDQDAPAMVVKRIKNWVLIPAGIEGFDRAEVTLGGVLTDQISSKTMEARSVPGLYFAGEVLDVTGELGGFNLHWAWASGVAAGRSA